MWQLNFDRLFETYKISRKWHEKGTLAALIFGDIPRAEITNVFFDCFVDFDATLDQIRFTESSLPSNVTFLGALSLVGAQYPFDLNALAVSLEDAENFVLVFADKTSLEIRDVDAILKLNEEIDLRPSTPQPDPEMIIRASLQLNAYVKMGDKGNLVDEISNVFLANMDNIESLCFMLDESDFVLGRSKVSNTKKLHEEMLRRSGHLADGRKFVNFLPLIPVSKNSDDSSQKLVPIVKVKKGLATFCNVRALIGSVAEVQRDDSPEEILILLRRAVKRAVHLAERCLCEFVDLNSQRLVNIRCSVFSPNIGLLLVVYPRIQDASVLYENVMRNYRIKLHRLFNLPPGKPMLRPSQALHFSPWLLINPHLPRLLRNPHLHIKSYKPIGEVSVVSGSYNYHHYKQGGVDDTGWGCAYRSFQTIWSWFVLQGYIDKPVPSHHDIQQSLYDCGDKDAKFVGSRQWIGSVELGYCLQNMANIESRVLVTNSGAEVAENARQLAIHFKIYGTPVMIGGGMLAHTILGVDFNESTGQSSFLILDPHYTGDEDLHTVISGGWCGWKTSNFWKQEHFYNLLLPIPPQNVI